MVLKQTTYKVHIVLSYVVSLSQQLRKSLIERVDWIYKCVYVSLRMGASVNLGAKLF